MSRATLYVGDALQVLTTLSEKSVQCCVTSPPYWGLRDYGTDGQLGLESTPEEYVAKVVEVCGEVRRVLRDDGTLWLNLGDSYNSVGHKKSSSGYGTTGLAGGTAQEHHPLRRENSAPGLKHKDLVGIPWRVAFALQADGWWLRSDIIWSKPNPMPESVTDRPTKAHEYVFLFSKSQRYFYDADAIAGPATHKQNRLTGPGDPTSGEKRNRRPPGGGSIYTTRNARSVWSMATVPYPNAHFATFPPELASRCIKAGTSQKGCCGECGAPWERVVEGVKYEPPTVAEGVRFVDDSRNDKTRRIDGKSKAWQDAASSRHTSGWQPTCDHYSDPVPCT
ncbi:hypothetical protein LCGC14_3096480, partial [marine sediment metagenome]